MRGRGRRPVTAKRLCGVNQADPLARCCRQRLQDRKAVDVSMCGSPHQQQALGTLVQLRSGASVWKLGAVGGPVNLTK